MKGLFVFTVLALLLGANAYQSIMPVLDPVPELLYASLFENENLGLSIQNLNSTVVKGEAACANTFRTQSIQVVKNFGSGLRQCLNITVQDFEALFNSKLYYHEIKKIKSELSTCRMDATNTDAKLQCYTQAVVNYYNTVRKMSAPYLKVSKDCWTFIMNRMERQYKRAYDQMTKCFAKVRAANPAQPNPPMSSN